MNNKEEKNGAPKNTNCIGKRGRGGKKNQDLGRVKFI